MIRAHLFISGFVQGVGYRQFVKSCSQKLGLTGWVRNLPDGRVEIMLWGPQNEIEEMIQLCKKGQLPADVREVKVLLTETEEQISGFTIRTDS